MTADVGPAVNFDVIVHFHIAIWLNLAVLPKELWRVDQFGQVTARLYFGGAILVGGY
jgi:hypothetical protein